VIVRRLNRYKVIEIWWLSGSENFVSERNNFIFNSFRNFTDKIRICVQFDVICSSGIAILLCKFATAHCDVVN